MHNFQPKKHLTLHYKSNGKKKSEQIRTKTAPNTTLKNYAKKTKIAQILARKAPNTTLKKLSQEKKNLHKYDSKKHLTLPYKNYAKNKNVQI